MDDSCIATSNFDHRIKSHDKIENMKRSTHEQLFCGLTLSALCVCVSNVYGSRHAWPGLVTKLETA